MDMDNTVSAVKKYWPWALGAVAGFWLLSQMGGDTEDTGVLTGSLYDPNLLASNLAMTQISADVQQAQIAADAQNNLAGWTTISNAFGSLANINQDFQAGQIASYQAQKEISVTAAQSMGDITSAGLLAAGASTQAFHNMVGQSVGAAGQIVGGVASANAQSASGAGRVVSSVLSFGF